MHAALFRLCFVLYSLKFLVYTLYMKNANEINKEIAVIACNQFKRTFGLKLIN